MPFEIILEKTEKKNGYCTDKRRLSDTSAVNAHVAIASVWLFFILHLKKISKSLETTVLPLLLITGPGEYLGTLAGLVEFLP